MQQNPLSDLYLSNITLGTVQLGMNYGIANKSGKPSYETARDIIKLAYENGITCLDTAAAYGNSEEVIGHILGELDLKDSITVVTKVRHIPEEQTDIEGFIENSIHESISRLGIDPLPVVLLHDETDVDAIGILAEFVNRGLIKHAGISVQSTKWAKMAFESGVCEAIQWPGSILDQRFERENIYEMASGRSAVFLRSVYLQGLLLMSDEDTIPYLESIIPIRTRLREIANQSGMGIAEMAMRYALSLDGCTSLVIGAESTSQIEDNARIAAKGPLPLDVMNEIRDVVPDLSEKILLPVNWPGK